MIAESYSRYDKIYSRINKNSLSRTNRFNRNKKKYIDDNYKNKKVIEFNILLTANHHTHFQNIHTCFPLKFKSAADNDNYLAARTIPVNNFYLLRKIDIVRYGDDQTVLPLINNLDIYRYL